VSGLSYGDQSIPAWDSNTKLNFIYIYIYIYIYISSAGKYVGLVETIREFNLILSGELDGLPEQAFYLVSNIDEATAKTKNLETENNLRNDFKSLCIDPQSNCLGFRSEGNHFTYY